MIPLNRPDKKKGSEKNYDITECFKKYSPSSFFQLVFSARLGLHIIYKKLYSEYGRLKVLVSPLTCYEALYPIIENGHEIIFSDISPETFNLDEQKITKDYDVLQAIHLGGNPQDNNELSRICLTRGKLFIEDAAQAFGSQLNDRFIGDWGDFSVFSFTKNLHSLVGGAILSKHPINESYLNSSDVLSQIAVGYLKLKRILELKSSMNNHFPWVIMQLVKKIKNNTIEGGHLNYNIAKYVCEILNQLNHLDFMIERRIYIAKIFREHLEPLGFKFQNSIKGGRHIYTRLFCFHPNHNTVKVVKFLRKKQIGANHMSQDILSSYQTPIWEHNRFKHFFSISELEEYFKIYNRIVAIPISSNLNNLEIEHIINSFKLFIRLN